MQAQSNFLYEIFKIKLKSASLSSQDSSRTRLCFYCETKVIYLRFVEPWPTVRDLTAALPYASIQVPSPPR